MGFILNLVDEHVFEQKRHVLSLIPLIFKNRFEEVFVMVLVVRNKCVDFIFKFLEVNLNNSRLFKGYLASLWSNGCRVFEQSLVH